MVEMLVSILKLKQKDKIDNLILSLFIILDVIFYQNNELEERIRQLTTHSEIDLRKQNLTDLDMGIIVQKAIIDRQCSALYLQTNKFSDDGISLLVHSLRNNTTITKLNLVYNPISDVAVRSLADLLAMNSTNIEKLYLASSRITDQSLHYLAEMLIANRTLKSLGLYNSEFTDQGVQRLACVLSKHNTTLINLYIEANKKVTDACVDSLIKMLNSNQSLTLIALTGLWSQ